MTLTVTPATVPPMPSFGCPRLIRQGRYARATCDRRPVGPDGLCRRHRYIERKEKAERERKGLPPR
jgi:hypothetical protein